MARLPWIGGHQAESFPGHVEQDPVKFEIYANKVSDFFELMLVDRVAQHVEESHAQEHRGITCAQAQKVKNLRYWRTGADKNALSER